MNEYSAHRERPYYLDSASTVEDNRHDVQTDMMSTKLVELERRLSTSQDTDIMAIVFVETKDYAELLYRRFTETLPKLHPGGELRKLNSRGFTALGISAWI